MKSLQGHLLVASPHLPDPNFFRSVVLIVQHNEDGAFGVVLNRPSQRSVGEIWNQVSDHPCQNQQPINVGGPLEGPLMAIHTQPDCAENEILPKVFFATERDHLDQIVTQAEHPFSLFSGYSGWGDGQLEKELKVGGWLTMPAEFANIFRDPADHLWKKLTQNIGSEIIRSTIHVDRLPDDPSMN